MPFSIDKLKEEFGDLASLVYIEREGNLLVIRPKGFIEDRAKWRLINSLVLKSGGTYQSAGKSSRWEIRSPLPPVKPGKTALDALVSESSTSSRFRTLMWLIDRLVPPKFRTRVQVEDDLESMIESIRREGVHENILVRPYRSPELSPDEAWAEVVTGDRRFTAAKKAGLTEIEVKLGDLTDEEAMDFQWTENEERKELTAYERARHLREMMKWFPEKYPNQETLGKKLGLTQQRISQIFSILLLEPDVTTHVVNSLTDLQVREILKAPEEERKMIAEMTVNFELSHQNLERLMSMTVEERMKALEDVLVVGKDALSLHLEVNESAKILEHGEPEPSGHGVENEKVTTGKGPEAEAKPRKPQLMPSMAKPTTSTLGVCRVCGKSLPITHNPDGSHAIGE